MRKCTSEYLDCYHENIPLPLLEKWSMMSSEHICFPTSSICPANQHFYSIGCLINSQCQSPASVLPLVFKTLAVKLSNRLLLRLSTCEECCYAHILSQTYSIVCCLTVKGGSCSSMKRKLMDSTDVVAVTNKWMCMNRFIYNL